MTRMCVRGRRLLLRVRPYRGRFRRRKQKLYFWFSRARDYRISFFVCSRKTRNRKMSFNIVHGLSCCPALSVRENSQTMHTHTRFWPPIIVSVFWSTSDHRPDNRASGTIVTTVITLVVITFVMYSVNRNNGRVRRRNARGDITPCVIVTEQHMAETRYLVEITRRLDDGARATLGRRSCKHPRYTRSTRRAVSSSKLVGTWTSKTFSKQVLTVFCTRR